MMRIVRFFAFWFALATASTSAGTAAACMAYAPLGRITAISEHIIDTRDPALLALLADRMQRDLDQVDAHLLAGLLREEFPFAEQDWINEALVELQNLANAAAVNDISAIARIADNPSLVVAFGRFRLAGPRIDCSVASSSPHAVGGFIQNVPTEGTGAEPANSQAAGGAASELTNGTRDRRREQGLRAPLIMASILALALSIIAAFVVRKTTRMHKKGDRETRIVCSYDTQLTDGGGLGLLGWHGGTAAPGEADAIHETRIINLHNSGACLKQVNPPKTQGQVRFRIGETWVKGSIRWHNPTCFGVMVDHPLTRAQLDEVLRPSPKDAKLPPLPTFKVVRNLEP